MLHINDLTYRIEGRTLFDQATAGIPARHKVGLVGRNGAGKTTLLRLIAGELAPDAGGIRVPRATRIGWMAQEAPGGPESLIDFVLAADRERTGAARRGGDGARSRPHRRHPPAPRRHRRLCRAGKGREHSGRASASTRPPSSAPARSSPAAGARAWRWRPSCSPSPTSCCSTSPPTTSTSKARCGSRTTCANIATPFSSSATTASCSIAPSPRSCT